MAKKEMKKKSPQSLNDEDLKNASGGVDAWAGIYPKGDPRWEDLRNYGSKRAEDQETSLKRMGKWNDFRKNG